MGWGTAFFDVDLDGRLDLAVANGSTLADANRPVNVTVRWIGGEESHHEGLAVDRRHRLDPSH